jgi:hypothetical protein
MSYRDREPSATRRRGDGRIRLTVLSRNRTMWHDQRSLL